MKKKNSPAMPFVAGAALLIAPFACHRPNHSQARVDAQQRWSEVRGRVKLQLARQQFSRGQFADAVKTLNESIGLDPSSVEAYTMFAKANLELGKPATAEQAIAMARNAGFQSADLCYLQGVILEQRGQLEAALAEFERARTQDADNVDYFIAHMESLVALGRERDALMLIDENADRFDDQASVAILGARVAALIGDVDGAIRRYQHPSVTIDRDPIVARDLGILLAQVGRCREAVRILSPLAEDATDDSNDIVQVRRSLATCYLSLNEPMLAVAVLLDHARRHGDDRSSQMLIARAATVTGDYITALRAIDAVRNVAKDDPAANLLLAAVHWKRGDLAGAETVLNGILSLDPYDLDAWCLLGELLHATGRRDEAETAFHRALYIDPELAWARIGAAAIPSGTGTNEPEVPTGREAW